MAPGKWPGPTRFRGLEQFNLRGDADGIGYCLAEAKPYSLEFSNEKDVICLLLGDISSNAKFEDDREKPLVFLGESAAFHPRFGNIRVEAKAVRHGFIAFAYGADFHSLCDDRRIEGLRSAGSRNNIRDDAIKFLARYVRERLRASETLQPLELQFLASGVYLETMRQLQSSGPARRHALSETEFLRLCDYIESNLDGKITCAELAQAVGLPLRAVFDGVKARTGRSPYSLVIEKRVERAQRLLCESDSPIADIACACGFSSQQHMTATLSRRLGRTPHRLRSNA